MATVMGYNRENLLFQTWDPLSRILWDGEGIWSVCDFELADYLTCTN